MIEPSRHELSPVTDGSADVACPRCGEMVPIRGKRPRADEFCPHCDYPVFWARPAWEDPSDDSAGRLRLPGTGGAADEYGILCPHCAEPNYLEAVVCIRCGNPMVIAPPTVFDEPVIVEELPPPPPPSAVSMIPYVVALAMAVVLLGFMVAVIG